MKNKLFKFGKPMLSIVVAVAILAVSLFAAVPGISFSANAAAVEDTWDGTMATGFASGSGAEDDPYIIATAEQLAYAVFGDSAVSAGKYFKVVDNATFNLSGMKDITLESTVGDVMTAATDKNWIGGIRTFAGYFDGNGVVIYNMYSGGNNAQTGLFPCPTNNNPDNASWIKNVTLLASRSNGFNSAGGLVGEYHAPDTSRTATIENCKVLNCWISDNNNTNATTQRTSGILAGNITHNTTTIKDCFASGNITSSTEISGGLVGNTSDYCPSVSIQNCIVIGSKAYPTVNGSNQKIKKHLNVPGTYKAVYTTEEVDAIYTANQVKRVAEADMKGAAAKANMPDFDWNRFIAFEGELPDYRANHTLTLAQNDAATHNITCTDCSKAMAETHTFVENDAGTMGICACGYSTEIVDRRTDVWDGSHDSNFIVGNGTKADPYIVKTAAQMAYLALKATEDETKGKYYKVAPNMVFNMNGLVGITMESTAEEVKNAADGKEWANDTNKFAGNFDGNGVIVYNIRSSNGKTSGYSALFPRVNTNNADTTVTIKNITVMASRFMGYHASAGIVGTVDCAAGGQKLIVENCAVKNCFIGDNGNTNTNCQRTAATIVGNCGNNIATINNCLSVDNILAGTDISGGFLGNSGPYSGSNSTIKNSVIIGSMPYPVLMPTASAGKAINAYANSPECFENVYTDQLVSGYSEKQIKTLTIADMSGVNSVQLMDLDFGSYWFANQGLIELLVSHNISDGIVYPDNNYLGHTASCKVCGLSSATTINHNYDDQYTCKVCGFECDHQYEDNKTTVEVPLDCVTPHQVKIECACGWSNGDILEEASGHNLVKTDAVKAQCAQPGNIEYWTCETCGKIFLSDDIWASMDSAVSIDNVAIKPTGEHTVLKDTEGKDVYIMNIETHKTVCSVCGVTIEEVNHTPEYKNHEAAGHSYECTVCHYEVDELEPHTFGLDSNECEKCKWTCSHEGTVVEVKAAEATCTEEGAIKDHYKCSVCDMRFENAAATIVIAKSEVAIKKLGHNLNGTYDYSKDQHWQYCDKCKQNIYEPHNLVADATGENGECICGYVGPIVDRQYDDWDGTPDSNLLGSGTKNDPYIIKTAEQLAYVVLYMPASESASKYFKVAPCSVFNMNGLKGIDLDSTAEEVKNAPIDKDKKWTLGEDKTATGGTFAGYFDGNGLVVYNLYSSDGYGALFPKVATVDNKSTDTTVSVKNVTVMASYLSGYHYSAGIIGVSESKIGKQKLVVENCAVKNCYIDDNGSTNSAAARTTALIVGTSGNFAATINNCFAANNILGGTDISGGFLGNAGAYGDYATIKNSVAIGNSPYPVLMPTASAGKAVHAYANSTACFENNYTDQVVEGYGRQQIRKYTLDQMSGTEATKNLNLDFDSYWFANEGTVELLVSHNISGTVNADDNYAGHNICCKVCGIVGVKVVSHTYDSNFKCTLCDFECDHKNENYINKIDVEFDCITPNHTKTECACGYAISRVDHDEAKGHVLEATVAKDPTCATAGNIEYYTCENCECIFLTNDIWASYDSAVEERDVSIPATGNHTIAADSNGAIVYGMDAESHWRTCTVCKAKLFRVEHEVVYTARGVVHDGTCDVCKYATASGEAHIFAEDNNKCDDCKWICAHEGSVVAVALAEPTCYAEGVKEAHYKCNVCDVRFADEAATETKEKDSVVIPKLGHDHIDFDENGTPVHEFNETHHWYNCKVCGKGDYAEHTIAVDTENYEGTYKWCEDEMGYGCNYSAFDYQAVSDDEEVTVTATTNAFTKEVITDIFKIKKDDADYEKFVEFFTSKGYENFELYEISPSQEMAEGSKANVKMLVPGMYGLRAAIVFVDLENDTIDVLDSMVTTSPDPTAKKGEDKEIVFVNADTERFGYFAIVSALDLPESDANVDNGVTSPPTGESAIFVATLIAILASVTVLFVRKAKI